MTSWLDTRIRKIQSAVPWAAWALLAILFLGLLWAAHVTTDEWISDSRLYLAWSYRYLGYSEAEAAQLTYDALVNTQGLRNCDFCWPAGFESSFFHGENGAVAAPRMIYPLLSAPFVGLMGPSGMMIIPLLAYAIGAVALVMLASRLWGRWWGVAAGVSVLLSAIAMRFAASAMTDSLALMFNTLALLFLPIARKAKRSDVWWFLALLVLNLFTRQFAITVAAGVAFAWLAVAVRDRNWRNQWLPFALGSIAVSGLVLKLQSMYAANFFDGQELSLLARYQKVAMEKYGVDGLGSVPTVIDGLVRVDYNYVRGLDFFLVALIVLTVVAVLWRYRSELSALFAGMAAATMAMTVIIVDPTYFRYFVPIIPLMILCGIALMHDLFVSGLRPSRSKETLHPVPDESFSKRKLSAPGPFGVQWLGWICLSAAFLLAAYLLWDNHAKFGLPRGILYAIGLGLFLIVVIKRSGVLAGVIAGLAVSFSYLIGVGLLSSFIFTTALPLVVVALACLPGSGFAIAARLRYAIFAGALGCAVLLTTRTLSVTVPIVVVWLLTSVKLRSSRNVWAPVAMISAALTGLGVVLMVKPVFGMPTYGRGNLGDVKRTTWLLVQDSMAWDRMFVAFAIIAACMLLVTWRSEMTWLAITSAVTAGILMFLGHPGALAGYFAYAALIVAMVAAGHLASFIRRDITSVPTTGPAEPEPPVIAAQRTGSPANA